MENHKCEGTFNSLQGLERQVKDVAKICHAAKSGSAQTFWLDADLKKLREDRQSSSTPAERTSITKKIWKVTRQKLREYCTN